jgi:hypothetical protein
MSIRTSLTLAALVAVAAPLAAQSRGAAGDKVPRGHLPPAGMCRIWVDGVPPGRQPKPTDCATARRQAPRNARVIYGEGTRDYRDDSWIDRVRREGDRTGRYDDRDDGDYKSDRVGDRKSAERGGRKDADRKATATEGAGVVIFGRDGEAVRQKDDDRREPDRKDSTRKR